MRRSQVILAIGTGVSATTLATVAALPTMASPTEPAPTASATLPTESLDILLTNDDGWDAPGITAVHAALEAAGHEVTVVAPATNQSGVSARVDFSGTLTALQPVESDPDVWSVSTSPVGTVLFALDQVLAERPDLVISGTNVGSNTGFDTNFSGTIGAATVAAGMFDLPAVAISTAITYGAEEDGAYAETAELLVDMIARGLPDLPRGQLVNINYPKLSEERPEPLGVRYAANSQASAAAFTYVQSTEDPTTYTIRGARGTEVPAEGTDSDLLGKGYVTVGVLDADRSVDAEDVPAVADLVAALDGSPVTEPDPEPTVGRLPSSVAAGEAVTVRTRHLADGERLRLRWVPRRGDARVVVRRGSVLEGVVTTTAPRALGRYRVAVKHRGTTLRSDLVKVG